MSETTPFLPDSTGEVPPIDDVYNRFSKIQKQVIVAIIALAAFASGCFVPCVPQVAKDLNTTGTVINYTVGVFVFTMALGTLIWAPYSRFYGRQPIYLMSLPLLCLGSLGVSLSTSVFQLVVGRIVQAFGASSVMSVGAATISDIYKLEERGTAMGIYFGAILMGPALAPLAGGLAATYASWRTMQLILFAMASIALFCVALFLPETCHPGSRGIDKWLAEEAPIVLVSQKQWKWVWLNPFKALEILWGPNVFLVVIAGGLTLVTDYVILIPLSYTIGPRYGLTSPALIGAFFIPSGLGNAIGAPLAGYLSDRAVIAGKKRRGGEWVPEDRLMATLSGALLFVPLSVLIVGLTTQLWSGWLGLVVNLVCLFFNGVGVDIVLAPANTYLVDILNTRSAEVMAVSSGVRNMLCALASAAVLPMINKIGVGATNGIAAVLAWIAFGLLWATIRYGDRMRAWIDLGYTTSSSRRDA
ncbi:MFS general substrate transporter [Ramaria rubella]|nr:MFS general substrate transporter [Ramaria rubella]